MQFSFNAKASHLALIMTWVNFRAVSCHPSIGAVNYLFTHLQKVTEKLACPLLGLLADFAIVYKQGLL